jgi:lipooligosaccharide transport system ATP-binding protein
MTEAPSDSAAAIRQPSDEQPIEAAIRLRGFVKRFGPITAVDGLDLDVPYGTCVGLLGPNGAGKSTTMKALTAQVIADEGELEILGYRLPKDSKQARAQMGVVPQLDNLDVALTVEQNLLVFAHLYRIPAAERRAAVERALEIAILTQRRNAKVSELSGGMRRRLLIARALIHRPRLVLLDEPTVGLDPQVRQGLWALIDGMRSEGVSILMSTHYIEEAERLCDQVTIMSHGRAVAVGPPRELIAEHAGREAIEVYGPPPRLVEVEQAHRDVRLDPALERHRRPRWRAPGHEPGGRLRPPDRRGDSVRRIRSWLKTPSRTAGGAGARQAASSPARVLFKYATLSAVGAVRARSARSLPAALRHPPAVHAGVLRQLLSAETGPSGGEAAAGGLS